VVCVIQPSHGAEVKISGEKAAKVKAIKRKTTENYSKLSN